MPALVHHCRQIADITLVELAVESDRPQWVRVRSQCRPVWPPRRHGEPAAGWDGASVEGVARPTDRFVAGYATPADPADPPARIVDTAPPDDETGDTGGDDPVTPSAVARALGDSGPPATAVVPTNADAPQDAQGSDREGPTTDESEDAEIRSDAPRPPDWLGQVARRVDQAEQLAAVTTAQEAHDAVAAAGGLEAVRELRAQLARDAETVAELRRRARRLDERLDRAEVPIKTIERVVE